MSAKENADNLMAAAMKAGITDPKELSNFMAQMQVESGGYSRMHENLGYSGSRLLEVFPGRNGLHTLSEANKVAAGGPEAVANKIYGGAYGEDNLGNAQAGDGWKYHGRGYVQLTGHDNYERLGKELGIDLVKHPELAENKDVAASIAVQYWKDRVQSIGQQTDVKGATYGINGGYNGLEARKSAAKEWESALANGYQPGGPDPIPGASTSHVLGSEKAKHVQALLGAHGYLDSQGKPLVIDGHAGKETHAAIERFQTDHHLKADGVVGPATLKALEQPPQQTASPSLADASHPSHRIYSQALERVERIDAQHGRESGPHTSNIAGSLTSAAIRRGMTGIDNVVLSHDASKAYAMQGAENSPFKQHAEVDVVQAAQTPLAQSSAEVMAMSELTRQPLPAAPVVTQGHEMHPEAAPRM